jgi:hypothetical protein
MYQLQLCIHMHSGDGLHWTPASQPRRQPASCSSQPAQAGSQQTVQRLARQAGGQEPACEQRPATGNPHVDSGHQQAHQQPKEQNGQYKSKYMYLVEKSD